MDRLEYSKSVGQHELDYNMLYCTVLYCTVLYCTVLYCTVLYCTVLYCTVLYTICNIHLIFIFKKFINNSRGKYKRNECLINVCKSDKDLS